MRGGGLVGVRVCVESRGGGVAGFYSGARDVIDAGWGGEGGNLQGVSKVGWVREASDDLHISGRRVPAFGLNFRVGAFWQHTAGVCLW